MNNVPSCVRFIDVSKSYFDGSIEVKILDNASFDIHTGKSTLILGRSGSGKSTLLNLISGVDTPTKGDILIDNISIGALAENDRTLFRRKNIGIVFQSFHLISSLNILENVMFPLELNNINGKEGAKSASQILTDLGLGDKMDCFPDTLSGGEQQRAAIARAIVHNPRIICADEPTGNLDSATQDIIIDLMFSMLRSKDHTLIMATHNEHLIDISDHAYLIENYKLKKIK